VTATHLPTHSDFTHGSSVLDFDGDGDVDLGLGWVNEFSRNVMPLNDGSGSFDMPETGSFPSPDSYLGDRIQHALVKDVTGDGLDDVLLHQSRTDFTDPALQLLISSGDGTFRDETVARQRRASLQRRRSALE